MKLIIDIPEKVVTAIQNGEDYRYDIHTAIAQGIPYEEKPRGDLISRDALKKAIHNFFDGKVIDEPAYILRDVFCYIDGAPTVEVRPQGEHEFIEILAQDMPDDLCTYPEYKGKPYYSIHYKENGEEFVGFGTYNLEVLSRYLRDYFIKGGAK